MTDQPVDLNAYQYSVGDVVQVMCPMVGRWRWATVLALRPSHGEPGYDVLWTVGREVAWTFELYMRRAEVPTMPAGYESAQCDECSRWLTADEMDRDRCSRCGAPYSDPLERSR